MTKPSTKRIVLAVGGTGGHIFPATALADQLRKHMPDIAIFFAGAGLHNNPYFKESSAPYADITASIFDTKSPWEMFKACSKIFRGFLESRRLLKTLNPKLIVGFGSYHTFPLLLAALYLKIPVLLHEANAYPGKVNRLLAPYATLNVTGISAAIPHLKGNAIAADMPLRASFYKVLPTKKQALSFYGLKPNLFTILVFGGSQGALFLNNLILEALTTAWPLPKTLSLQVIHLVGSRELEPDLFRERYRGYGHEACVKPFETNMMMAWRASDIVVGRAGASTIAEATHFSVPAILVPYPYAADDHQGKNAAFMSETVGASITFRQESVTATAIADSIVELSKPHSGKYALMKSNLEKHRQSKTETALSHIIEDRFLND